MSEELPSGWQSAALRDIAEIVGGVTKDAKKSAGTGFREVPYLRVANVQRGWLDLTDVKLIAASEADIQKLSLLPGDILLNEGGDRDKLGRGWIWQGQLSECIHQNHVFRARLLSRDIDPVYVAHFTNSVAQTYFAAHGAQTTNLASISLTKLGSLPIRLPPAAEQTRIVAKLEELLSDLDAGVAELKAAQAKLQQYRQSLLKAAVEGALTQAWREAHPKPEETGADLLARILRERRARWEARQLAKFEAQGKALPTGWQDKYPEPVAPKTFDLPSLPDSWAWATLSQLGWLDRGRSKHRPRNAPHLYGGPYPFVQTGDIRHADTYLCAVGASYSEAGLAQSRLWPAGTLCITIAANIGKTAILGMAACFPDSVVGFLPASEAVSVRYVDYFMRSAQALLEDEAPATAQKNINLETLERLCIPLPPASEIREMVEALNRALDGIKALDTAVDMGLKQSTAQRQNLLRAAFAGQLVPQDPADEPASELLARIRAERAQQAPVKRRGRRTETA